MVFLGFRIVMMAMGMRCGLWLVGHCELCRCAVLVVMPCFMPCFVPCTVPARSFDDFTWWAIDSIGTNFLT